ncbi:MAG TPA: hypothetical protein VFO91_05515 [Anaerolineales bacterium]|nr:hypothetical protein [Anaerolineales bacterium]
MNSASYAEPVPVRSFWIHFVPIWIIGSSAAYFLTGFFSNFYPSTSQFVFLSLVFQIIPGTVAVLMLEDILLDFRINWHRDWTMALALGTAFCFSAAAVILAWQFPGLFDRRILFMDPSRLPLFITLAVISTGATAILLRVLNQYEVLASLRMTRVFRFGRQNLPGIVLALFFLFAYFTFAESINFPEFRTLDQYFDTDISVWLERLTSPSREEVSRVRAVHPAVLLFLRPPVWLVSIFLNGDRLHALFLIHALAGATCVLLAWLILKQATGNQTYSLIMASLLGASASHLLLGSMLETYIYSALALILFTLLMQGENTSLKFTVPAGVLVSGITVSNLIQTCILYLTKYPRLKTLAKYVLLVVLIVSVLNILQVWLYPNARLLLIPDNLLIEQRYGFDFESSWKTTGRFSLTVRAILLYGIVAPKPFILIQELGANFPNFRTFQIALGEFHIAGYIGLADMTVKFWMVILAAAGILFIRDFFQSPRQVLFSIGLVLCLGFNLVLHTVYGDDPMLYSPNWVYALVFFVALSLKGWADRKWLQAALITFVGLMMAVNLGLVHQIMTVALPYYGK